MRHGERIRRARLKAKMEQGELARRIGISQAFLSRIETGKRGCSSEILERAARALGVGLEELCSPGDDPVRESLEEILRDPEVQVYLRRLRGNGDRGRLEELKCRVREAILGLDLDARKPSDGEI
ncbi:transcriptional regulator, XRE family [Thermanaerovibrio acidaminovorans DSM 6589]|jgi:transcriptional regulator with XRE-family HTH domain|uniref:Transcriptional regulator, XRE family n=2 Tax=Thermanaerovibrio TaxID=81461 RepID=D1B715_THEAS|nr:transcriptional regulator, XRE family [Thermanaerovibrio acidaminovorans DSM 6589]